MQLPGPFEWNGPVKTIGGKVPCFTLFVSIFQQNCGSRCALQDYLPCPTSLLERIIT